MHMSLFQFGFERRKYPSASAENSVRCERPVNEEEEEKEKKEFEAEGSKERRRHASSKEEESSKEPLSQIPI